MIKLLYIILFMFCLSKYSLADNYIKYPEYYPLGVSLDNEEQVIINTFNGVFSVNKGMIKYIVAAPGYRTVYLNNGFPPIISDSSIESLTEQISDKFLVK